MKCQILFSGKNIINLSSAEFAHNMLLKCQNIDKSNIKLSWILTQVEFWLFDFSGYTEETLYNIVH